MDTNQFWERQPDESDTAYNAFCVYRDMGITRSLRKAAAAFYADRQDSQEATSEPPESGTDSQLTRFKRWSRKWMWAARAEAHDAEEDHERRLELKERRIKAAETNWRVAQLALVRVAQRLQQMGLDEELPLKQLPSMTRAALELQRAALGEPGLVVDVRSQPRPPEEDRDDAWIDALTLTEREELVRLAGLMSDAPPTETPL